MDNSIDSPTWQRSVSDEEVSGLYSTVSSAPPKRKAGRTKFKETRHPIYKGVRQRNADKWVCEVREPNKKSRIWLGTFPTAEMAARAHDVAAMTLRGRSACLNFADSAWLLPVPNSSSPKDIQKTAAEAAERFRPTEIGSDHSVGLRHHNNPMETEIHEEEEAMKNNGTNWYDYGNQLDGYARTIAEEGWFSLPPSPTIHHQLYGSDEGYNNYWDDTETSADVSLWSFSI